MECRDPEKSPAHCAGNDDGNEFQESKSMRADAGNEPADQVNADAAPEKNG
jgi:hypothetical protein